MKKKQFLKTTFLALVLTLGGASTAWADEVEVSTQAEFKTAYDAAQSSNETGNVTIKLATGDYTGTDTVLKTKLLSRKMACINIYSVFRFECPHNLMPCCKVFLRWGISKDKSAICLQTSCSNHVWRLSPVGVVFDVYGAVACCNPAFTCCF